MVEIGVEGLSTATRVGGPRYPVIVLRKSIHNIFSFEWNDMGSMVIDVTYLKKQAEETE